MEKLTFKFADYEGPLDLILFLISKHKLDIFDINISDLLEQYLKYIEGIEERSPETASDFLEMAARLVYIKTVSLLPKREDEEKELKEELTGQLIELRMCKEAAYMLSQLYKGDSIFVRSQEPVEADKTYERVHLSSEIMLAYLSALGKHKRFTPPPIESFKGIVATRVVSVSSRIVHIMKRLYRESEIFFSGLFYDAGDRSGIVATFLATLELIKSRRISIEDDGKINFIRTKKNSDD
ncbi:MAG: segregation/condensation protein A [Oscillospiraceae bacterium]|nr:segregation/condensation protein A [Oscillospiraceae bacterium]